MALVQGNAAQVASLPAPVGGWNARDSLANMEPTDAVTLENLFPQTSNVVLRGGYAEHATGLGGQVQSLMVYNSGATVKMFGAAATSLAIYDVTAAGAVGAAVVSSIANAKYEYINVTTAAGGYLYAVNGADAPLLYNGTTWVSVTAISTIAITGVTTTNLSNIQLFKNRVWFLEKDTLKAWYLPTNAVGGAAQALDMSAIAKQGGSLINMDAWTIDAGYGVDDQLVFITSNGEVIVWRGTDPASASSWALAGIWKLGAPVGNRCMLKYGGDLLVLTTDGLLPLAQALQSSRLDPRVALSNKISGAISLATQNYKSNFGWEIVFSPENNAVWINVPVAVGQQEQYVMNTITQSWCKFTNWDANCFGFYDNQPYFGGSGTVYKAWNSNYKDDTANIATNSLQAFNYFESRGVQKYFTRARPSLFTDGLPEIFLGVNVDFNVQDTAAAISAPVSVVGLWDSGLWDSALWGAGLQITNNWQGITGIGYCAALQFKSASSGLQIEWAATDVVFQGGWAGI